MPLSRWVLALADSSGRTSGSAAALATVTSLPNLDERALVSQAQAGNRAAFEDLVRRYDRDVLRLALNLMKRPEDARDVYQEAFLKVYRNLHRFRFECSFYTWLYRIVTNVFLDHRRPSSCFLRVRRIDIGRTRADCRSPCHLRRLSRPAFRGRRAAGRD